MGMDSFAPGVYPDNGSYFWVQNIANPPKCVEIFNYPVAARGGVRNLMLIPGVGEQDIKESLLKGSNQKQAPRSRNHHPRLQHRPPPVQYDPDAVPLQ